MRQIIRSVEYQFEQRELIDLISPAVKRCRLKEATIVRSEIANSFKLNIFELNLTFKQLEVSKLSDEKKIDTLRKFIKILNENFKKHTKGYGFEPRVICHYLTKDFEITSFLKRGGTIPILVVDVCKDLSCENIYNLKIT